MIAETALGLVALALAAIFAAMLCFAAATSLITIVWLVSNVVQVVGLFSPRARDEILRIAGLKLSE
jgi:hypothetical protein